MALTKVLLGELLVQRGVITPAQLDQALALQREDPRYLGRVLLQLGLLNEETLLSTLAEQLRIPYM